MAHRATGDGPEEHILRLMRSDDHREIKNGIQGAYEHLRANPGTSKQHVDGMRIELSRHLSNQDPLITPWIYSLIAVLGEEQYTPYLRTQLANHEFDPVNRTWAVASLANIVTDYRAVLDEIDDDLTLPYRLASAMYRGPMDDARMVREAGDTDDRLTHLWICLLFSESRAQIPVELVKELTKSRDAEVAQYALFALHKHPRTGLESALIGPQDIAGVQPRVRRWYYQVLLKDPTNLDRYRAFLLERVETETSSQAREGLAKGFIGLAVPRTWTHHLRSWAESENDPYVLDALLRVPDLRDISRRSANDAAAQRSRDDLKRSEGSSDPVPGTLFNFNAERVVIMVDRRDQRVRVGGTGNTIGSVQGAYSRAVGTTVTAATDQDQDVQAIAPQLIDLLRSIALTVREQSQAADQAEVLEHAEMLELVAGDVEEEAAAVVTEPGRLARLKARCAQAGVALGALAGVTESANHLVTQAQDLIGALPH